MGFILRNLGILRQSQWSEHLPNRLIIMNTKVAKHLSIPENRINYSFYFLDNFGYEFVDYKKCYDAIAKWSDNLDTSESHFWWNTHLLSFKDDGWKSLTDYHLQLNGLLLLTRHTSNEHHNSNISDQCHNRRRIVVILKRYANTPKDTKGNKITE